ncbi:hypothetical protein APY03_2088 [Variovorax sp. WDL1]|nr:hypothetical protein APY03_2088 [Variovorax sp. WDL1]
MPHHALQQRAHDESVALGDGAHRLVAHRRRRLDQHLALVIGDARHQRGAHAIAAIGEDRVRRRHLHRRDRAGTQRHRQVRRVLRALEAEAVDPVLRVAGPDRLQHADGDHVLRLLERAAQGHRAFEAAVVVPRLPGRAARRRGVEEQRCVVDQGARREALLECRRIDEGLEARAGLAPGLGHMVELVPAEVEAAHQGPDRTVARVERHEGAFDLGRLQDLPRALGRPRHADHRAAAHAQVRRAPRRQAGLGRAQALARDPHALTVAAHGHYLLRISLQHHDGQHLAAVGMPGQRFVDRIVQPGLIGRIGRQLDEALRPAPGLPPLVVQDALAQGPPGRRLLARHQRGEDLEAARVGAGPVLRDHQLPHGLGRMLRMQALRLGRVAQAQRFQLRFGRLRRADGAGRHHAVQHMELTDARTARVAHRVVGARRLGQAGQHGGLRERDLPQRLAEVALRGRGEAIGAMAEEDLVQVDLENLVLAQVLLEPEGQQRLQDLALQGPLGAQVDVARHLLRDGGGALVHAMPQVGQHRAQQALGIDARVLVEAGVFHRHHRVLELLGHLGDTNQLASLFAELADQHTVSGVDAQRQLGPVVGELGHVGQLRGQHRNGDTGRAQRSSCADRHRGNAPQHHALRAGLHGVDIA